MKLFYWMRLGAILSLIAGAPSGAQVVDLGSGGSSGGAVVGAAVPAGEVAELPEEGEVVVWDNLIIIPPWSVTLEYPAENTGVLMNVSTRGFVIGHDKGLTAGFVISEGAHYVLIRGVGPGLLGFGVTDALPQPRLRLYDAEGNLLREATAWSPILGWGSAEEFAIHTVGGAVGAFPLGVDSADCAVHLRLEAGVYSVVIDSVDPEANGEVLVEVYSAPGYTVDEP